MRDLVARTALYDLVWSVPMRKLATQLQMSDRGLAKLCARENIPVPPRGYWTKLRHEKPVKKPAFGPAPDGHREWIPIAPPGSDLGAEGRDWLELKGARRSGAASTAEPGDLAEPEHDHDLHVCAWQVLGKARRVRVRTSELSPANRHREVERILTIGKENAWRFPYPPNPFRGPGPRRRLAFLNALFVALERLGGSATITDLRAEEIEVRFSQARVPCRLKSTYVRLASGERTERLDFHVIENGAWSRDRQVWKERRGLRLEERLSEILVGIVLAVELERREHDWEWYREDLRWREERRREQARLRNERQMQGRAELIQQARAMQDARAIRELVAAVGRGASGVDTRVASWQAWALEQAEAIDPVCGGRLSFELPD